MGTGQVKAEELDSPCGMRVLYVAQYQRRAEGVVGR
jgi:hypothetical protein